jgi:hypothetical protein
LQFFYYSGICEIPIEVRWPTAEGYLSLGIAARRPAVSGRPMPKDVLDAVAVEGTDARDLKMAWVDASRHLERQR